MSKLKIEENQRRAVNSRLGGPYHKEYDFIEVTEWSNGEGYDVTISDKQQFSIHFTEWDVLKKLIKHLDK